VDDLTVDVDEAAAELVDAILKDVRLDPRAETTDA
jgi:hypothetical protein